MLRLLNYLLCLLLLLQLQLLMYLLCLLLLLLLQLLLLLGEALQD